MVIAHAILESETNERLRIARDLHDGLAGLLSVIKLNLQDIAKQYANKQLEKALTLLEQSITELRHIAHHMMPESLINEGLKTSLEDFCQTIPNVHFEYIGNDSRLSKQLEILIYRCAYELINNALKYANAETINVQLIVDSKLISFTVYDNGIGFDYKSIKQGTGLRNIRTRIVTYNGKLNIYSSQGKGSEINIEIENYDNSTYNG
mgnify:FL=1